jgi:hypothetical protein
MDETTALPVVETLLKNKGMNPVRITQNMYPNKKITDFKVEWGQGGLFYCEVKSPKLILDPITNLFKHVTTMSKLRDDLHYANKQFKSVNPSHIIPNVLIWTSDYMQLNWSNFVDCLRGRMVRNGKIIKDLSNADFIVRTNKDIGEIDIYIWLQIGGSGKVIQKRYFYNKDSLLTPYKLFTYLRKEGGSA